MNNNMQITDLLLRDISENDQSIDKMLDDYSKVKKVYDDANLALGRTEVNYMTTNLSTTSEKYSIINATSSTTKKISHVPRLE